MALKSSKAKVESDSSTALNMVSEAVYIYTLVALKSSKAKVESDSSTALNMVS